MVVATAPAVVRQLREGEIMERHDAAYAIGYADDPVPGACDALVSAMNDPNAKVRKAALSALIHLDPERAYPVALAALDDKASPVRRSAIFAFLHKKVVGDYGAAVEPLCRIVLKDRTKRNRSEALNVLCKIGGEGAIWPLSQALAQFPPQSWDFILVSGVIGAIAARLSGVEMPDYSERGREKNVRCAYCHAHFATIEQLNIHQCGCRKYNSRFMEWLIAGGNPSA